MMQKSSNCLREDQLRRLMDDAMNQEDSATTIDHLSHCGACADQLERMTAADEFWRSSARSLRSDSFDCDFIEDTDSPASVSPVLMSLLGPTEDPQSLGRVGRFEVLGVVGSGGMGTVLKARDVDIERVVALKLPAAHLLESPSALERIEREARSAATIRHPGVIAIYQVERWRNIPYLVMPYHTGPSLRARISKDGPLDLLESIRIARQTAEALAAAHDHGVVHRDVKPGNILLGKGTERAVLTDFGIAKVQHDEQMTATGVIVGTPAFLSPEQANGGEATQQSDLFCLGTVLWTMLAGRPPFVDLPTHSIVASIASGQLPRLREFRADLPNWVYRLIDWMQQPDPADRPDSAGHCVELLRGCEQHLANPILHALPEIANRPSSTRRAGKIAALLTLLLLVPLGYGFRPGQPDGDLPPTPTTAPAAPSNIAPAEAPDELIDTLSQSVDEMDREMEELLVELQGLADPQPNKDPR